MSLLFTSFVLLAYTVLFEYTNSRDQLFAVQKRSLEAFVDFKVFVINNYFSRLRDEALSMQYNHSVRTAMPAISSLINMKDNQEYLNLKKDLDSQFQSWLSQRRGILDVMLLDKNGRVVYVMSPMHSPELDNKLFDPCGDSFIKGMNDIYISDSYSDYDRDEHVIRIFVPIFDFDNNFSGEFVVEADTDELDKAVEETSGLGKTGETELGRLVNSNLSNGEGSGCYDEQGDSVLFLSSLRSEPNAAFRKTVRIGDPLATALQAAARGENGSGIYTDYAGRRALAVWRYLPDRHWGLVTKIDYDELMLPVRTVVKSSLIFGPLIFFILILIAVRLADAISSPIVKLTGVAKKIGEGDLDVEFDNELIFAGNEVGILATTLKKSVASLAEVYRNLEKKVTERTAQIKEAQVKEEAILKSIGDGIINTDENGLVVFVNAAAQIMLRMNLNQMAGKKISDVINIEDETGSPLPPNEGPIIEALSSSKTTVLNIYPKIYYFVRRDKSRFPVSLTTAPVLLEGKTIGAIEVFRDITLEHDIDKAKTEFVSLASHQLRTPLTAISWYAEMLLAGDLGPLSRAQKKFLREVQKSNHRMLTLVGALLNVSRLELGTFIISPELTDINAVARGVIAEMMPEIKKRNIKLRTDLDAELPAIQTDPKLIGIIIQNLLSNAIKYSSVGGSVTLSIRVDKSDIIITVSDKGFGIPKSQQPQIFTKLFRADNARQLGVEGTGLGLYLVKSIVNYMEGKIWFDSEENKGATFHVSLPLSGVKPKKGTRFLQ